MQILLEKNYQVSAEMFSEGCRQYNKTYADAVMWIRIAILSAIALSMGGFVLFVPPGNLGMIPLLIFVILIASIFKEFSRRNRISASLGESYADTMQDETYTLRVTDSTVEILTIPKNEGDEVPVPSVYPRDNNLKVTEKENLFLLTYAKEIFYILPKEFFNFDEQNIIRAINKQ